MREAGAVLPLTDIGVKLRDFADTAAVISQLDLVIGVDTSVVHLAGALGKSVWVLVPTPADWRWMRDREDSPWYPTMRLFRQMHAGNWDDVLQRLRASLVERVAQHRGVEIRVRPSCAEQRFPHSTPAPSDAPLLLPLGHCAVAETRFGILQYWPEQTPIGTSIERYGEFLQCQLDSLARLIHPGSTVVEAAAGVGVHSLFLSSAIGPSGHLLLYEHDPLRKRVLQQNMIANRVGNATLMRRNLGAREAEWPARSTASTEAIDDLRLEALHWITVNDPALSAAILDGATDTLWRLRPALVLAAVDEPEVHKLAATARDFGYQCFHMETPLFNPDNFNRRPNDVFGGRHALSLLAFPEEAEIDVPLDHCIRL
jgi:hypothetical protein